MMDVIQRNQTQFPGLLATYIHINKSKESSLTLLEYLLCSKTLNQQPQCAKKHLLTTTGITHEIFSSTNTGRPSME